MRRGKERPLRVVQACDLQAGGISSMILAVCENLDREAVNFDYLVYRDQEEFEDRRVQALGGRKLVASNTDAANKFEKFIYKFFRTYRVLRQERAEIFHINASTPYDCLVGLAARLAGVRTVILHAHNSRPEKSGKGHLVFQNICRMFQPLCGDRYFACSNLANEFMYGSGRRKKAVLVKNGIDTRRFQFDETVRRQMRKRYGIQDALVVGHIGRLCPQKNQGFLIQIFAELRKLRKDARLVLIGQGELERELMDQVERLELQDSILYISVTSQPEQFYCMMDLFLLPSLYEGLPVVGVEAQASGLPCIFSDSITRELSITDRAHYLSLEQSPAEWAEQAVTLAGETETDRSVYAIQVRQNGFEIRDTAKWLQSFYLSL